MKRQKMSNLRYLVLFSTTVLLASCGNLTRNAAPTGAGVSPGAPQGLTAETNQGSSPSSVTPRGGAGNPVAGTTPAQTTSAPAATLTITAISAQDFTSLRQSHGGTRGLPNLAGVSTVQASSQPANQFVFTINATGSGARNTAAGSGGTQCPPPASNNPPSSTPPTSESVTSGRSGSVSSGLVLKISANSGGPDLIGKTGSTETGTSVFVISAQVPTPLSEGPNYFQATIDPSVTVPSGAYVQLTAGRASGVELPFATAVYGALSGTATVDSCGNATSLGYY